MRSAMKQLAGLILVALVLGAHAQTSTNICADIRSAVEPLAGISPDPVKIQDGKLVDSNNQPVSIKGLSWFGFNNNATMVDGLWAGGLQAATDFAMIVYQLQLFGFNTIRLPFKFDDLDLPAKDQDRNCQFTREEALKTRVLDPLLADTASNRTLPKPQFKEATAVPEYNVCNRWMPEFKKTLHRLLWTIEYFISNGFYVILDYQPLDPSKETLPYDSTKFVNSWATLWKSVTCLANFDSDLRGRIFLELMNEPDAYGIVWSTVSAPVAVEDSSADQESEPAASPEPAAASTPAASPEPAATTATSPATTSTPAATSSTDSGTSTSTTPSSSTPAATPAAADTGSSTASTPETTPSTPAATTTTTPAASTTTTPATTSTPAATSTPATSASATTTTTSGARRRLQQTTSDTSSSSSKPKAPTATEVYARTMDTLFAITPNAMLFIICGTGQAAYTKGWGNGFVTDADIIKAAQLSDPNFFFTSIKSKPYNNSIIVAPSMYPPSLLSQTLPPAEYWKRMANAVGYLKEKGYGGIKFPIVVTQFKSRFDKVEDIQWLTDFAKWLQNPVNIASTDSSGATDGWVWWVWNANSGEPDGLVSDNWQNLQWNKLRYMVDRLGLKPWYKWSASEVPRNLNITKDTPISAQLTFNGTSSFYNGASTSRGGAALVLLSALASALLAVMM